MAARLEKLRNEAVYAAESGNYETALQKLNAASIVFDTTPNGEKDGVRLEFRRIEELIKRFEKLAAKQKGFGKVRRLPHCLTRPTDDLSYR